MKPQVLIICAHPDDAELGCGGFILKYKTVFDFTVVIITNGCLGDNNLNNDRNSIVLARRDEASKAANFAGVNVIFEDYNDGELVNSLELRRTIVKHIRTIKPYLVFTHKDNDYHPDHRYLSKAIQDSLVLIYCTHYMKEIPAIDYIPPVLFFWNKFTYPFKFHCDVLIDITEYIEEKKHYLSFYSSQFNDNQLDNEVFTKAELMYEMFCNETVSSKKRYCEAFEICQYLRDDEKEQFLQGLKKWI